MVQKTLPFTKAQIDQLRKKHPTPWHVYDERGIKDTARKLNKAFSWAPGFKNYFAVKALPNPSILKITKAEGMGADCSSMPEIRMSDEKAGIRGENIMFTSNDTPTAEFIKAREIGAIINLDDITHISFLVRRAGMPNLICFRYNPGPARKGNPIIGKPEEAKYGFTKEQLFAGYSIAKEHGAKRFGLHTMIASNELNPDYFVETARMLFDLAVELKKKINIRLEFVNMGGGIGIPYKPEQQAVDIERISKGVKAAYQDMIIPHRLHPLKIFMENGRYITGPHGYLVSSVLHRKHIYRKYVGLDACMANLMRPALYGAYHHITVMGKENWKPNHVYDVTGSLCENNDKFAIQRQLPKIEEGDIVVIHDTGAHGYAMGFNYNGKLRSAEFLLTEKGTFKMIRRAETYDDYTATLEF